MNEDDTPPELPCHPCPYDASCCAYGTTLTEEEAAAIEAALGPGLVMRMRWGEWRTRVRNKRCVLYRSGGGCAIHAMPFYPAVCRGFPWTDSEGAPYEYDTTICGAIDAHPQLVTLQRRSVNVRA